MSSFDVGYNVKIECLKDILYSLISYSGHIIPSTKLIIMMIYDCCILIYFNPLLYHSVINRNDVSSIQLELIKIIINHFVDLNVLKRISMKNSDSNVCIH